MNNIPALVQVMAWRRSGIFASLGLNELTFAMFLWDGPKCRCATCDVFMSWYCINRHKLDVTVMKSIMNYASCNITCLRSWTYRLHWCARFIADILCKYTRSILLVYQGNILYMYVNTCGMFFLLYFIFIGQQLLPANVICLLYPTSDESYRVQPYLVSNLISHMTYHIM